VVVDRRREQPRIGAGSSCSASDMCSLPALAIMLSKTACRLSPSISYRPRRGRRRQPDAGAAPRRSHRVHELRKMDLVVPGVVFLFPLRRTGQLSTRMMPLAMTATSL